MEQNPKQTIIEEGTEFDGSVTSKCGITLSGKLKGELSAPSLTVKPSGSVNGQVMVEQLRSEGEITGEIEAETVELSGKVNDQTVIRASTLQVKLDQPNGLQVAFGNCELRVGEASPNKKKAKAVSDEKQSKPQQAEEVLVATKTGL